MWLSNLFGNSGVSGYGNLNCTSMATAPAMPNAGSATPANCKGSTGAPAVTVNTVDPNLKFPETWRSSLGYDRRLPWNVIATIEGMYTRSVNSFYYQNIGLEVEPDRNRPKRSLALRRCPEDDSDVVDRRIRFPVRDTIPGTTSVLGDVFNLQNTPGTKDYAYSFTGQLRSGSPIASKVPSPTPTGIRTTCGT